MIARTLLVVPAAALLLPATAGAEPATRVQDPSGASIGCGYLACRADSDDSTVGGTTNWSGSVAYRGRATVKRLPVAVAAQGWGMAHHDDELAVTQGLVTLGVRGWIAPEAWVQTGLGVARRKLTAERTALVEENETATAATAGMGAELISRDDFVLNLAIHAGAGVDAEDDILVYNVSVGVGGTFE